MGLLFAFIALLCWGLGDFLIQKGARRFGSWLTLFYITALMSIILLPFVYKELFALCSSLNVLIVLLIVSVVVLLANIFDFQGLKLGKMSVVEPIYSFELPITAILAALIIGEYLNFFQTLLIFSLFVGIILLSIKSFNQIKKIKLEKGILYALLATLCMGVVNFVFGFGARHTSPLLINWFTGFFMFICCLIFLIKQGRLKEMVLDFKKNKKLIFGVSIVDNLAWIAFAFSTLYIPIAIATGISESYIALAAGLGLIFNKEKLKTHQFIGLAVAVLSVILLAYFTS
ncbi:MAG: EamA family transporter [Patescibacteria group bacterium]